jgi:hypothetical protein
LAIEVLSQLPIVSKKHMVFVKLAEILETKGNLILW